MFLATTALDQYWDKNEKILFLGDWCIKDKSTVKDLDYELHSDNWDKISKIQEAEIYLYNIYLSILPFIKLFMNSIHNKNFSEKYWETLLGPWLFNFIEISYDRYLSLKRAHEKYNGLNTIVTKSIYPTKTFAEWGKISESDDLYNFILFSEIIQCVDMPIEKKFIDLSMKDVINIKEKTNGKNGLSFNVKERKTISELMKLGRIYKLIQNLCENFVRKLYLLRQGIKNDIIDLGMPMDPFEKDKFFNILKQKQTKYKPPKPLVLDNIMPNKTFREKTLFIKSKDQFMRLLSKIIVTNMPMEYLEYYSEYRSWALNHFPKHSIKLILLRSAFESRSDLRFFLAEKTIPSFLHHVGNPKKVVFQEGGGSGCRAIGTFYENVYTKLSENFLTWGWISSNEKTKNFFLIKTFWIKNYNYNHNGDILLIGSSCRNYFATFYASHIPGYNSSHIGLNKEFIGLLKKKAFNRLIYRFQWEFGYHESTKILNQFPTLKISKREENTHYYDLLYNSSIAVITTNMTTMLQTFILNHPTVMLWDPQFFRIRKSASKYYDQLHSAGILYYDPVSCAEKLNEIYRNPMEWWMTDKVQSAKNDFCSNFCRKSENLPKDLVEVINELGFLQ